MYTIVTKSGADRNGIRIKKTHIRQADTLFTVQE